MSPRYAARVDNNHREIVLALQGVGASVASLARLGQGVPDLLVWHRGLYLLEVKSGPKEPLTPDEEAWHAGWSGPVHVVRSVEEALQAIGIREAGESR